MHIYATNTIRFDFARRNKYCFKCVPTYPFSKNPDFVLRLCVTDIKM